VILVSSLLLYIGLLHMMGYAHCSFVLWIDWNGTELLMRTCNYDYDQVSSLINWA